MKWTTKGFDAFRKGTFGNGGQNLYVTASGTLQRIFNFDVNGDGYVDLPLANSHSMNERPPLYIYDRPGQEAPLCLPTNGAFDAIFTDLSGDGTEDLVVACQHNGVLSDITALVYYGSGQGLCEKYRTELTVPNAFGVAAGDFRGRGKKDLVFISGKKLRLFPYTELGIQACKFEDLDISAISLTARDYDGDGFEDLCVVNGGTGDMTVYWGSENGLDLENKTDFGKALPLGDSGTASTTAGRMLLRWLAWITNTVTLKGRPMIFRAEREFAVFESFGADRKPREEFRFRIYDPATKQISNPYRYAGVVHAAVGDLRGDGSADIVIAHSTNCEAVEDLLILWESEGYDMEKATRIPIRSAYTLFIGPLEQGGQNHLFVCQRCRTNDLQITHQVFRFHADKTPERIWTIDACEASRVICGRTYTDGRYQTAVINHEGETKLGLEDISVFLGGEDGYQSDRRIALPGCAAVDCIPVSTNDSGKPDLLVVNCAENAPHLDPGALLYRNSPEGYHRDDRHCFDTILAHGAAVGDFRHSGYLDFIFGGICNRELRIFEGGPDGYTMKKLVLGPDPEKFVPLPWDIEDLDPDYSEEESKRIREFGNIRWLHAADYNGDGWLDIFVSEITCSNSFILWGGPEGYSAERMQTLAVDGVAAANAADLDGDGYLDLVLACHLTRGHSIPNEKGKFVIYWGGPGGFRENRRSFLPTYCANAVTIQDFNGDGLLDIYGTAYNNGRCRDIDSRLYFQTPDRMFHLDNYQHIFNHSGCGCMSGDFNGDGYIDLAVASHKAYGRHVNSSYVFWGGPDGIDERRYTELPGRGPHGMCSVDIGNIMDRSDSEYYLSEIYPIPEGMRPAKVSWQAKNGIKTWVKLRLRCGVTEEALQSAPWFDPCDNGADITALPLTGLLQYQLELGAACGCGTPRVTEVTVEFTTL